MRNKHGWDEHKEDEYENDDMLVSKFVRLWTRMENLLGRNLSRNEVANSALKAEIFSREELVRVLGIELVRKIESKMLKKVKGVRGKGKYREKIEI